MKKKNRDTGNGSSLALLVVANHPLNTANDGVIRSRSLAVQNLDSDEGHIAGDTERVGTNRTSDVGTVTIAIRV